MMIGKAESASYVDSNLLAGKEHEDGTAKVSRAIQGKTIGERNEELLDDLGKKSGDAYQVDISDEAKKRLRNSTGTFYQILGDMDWTRKDEMEALGKAVERYQDMKEKAARGENVDPWSLDKAGVPLKDMFPAGTLDASPTATGDGVFVKDGNIAQIMKTATGLEETPVRDAGAFPVAEIRTEHYRWTEEKGVEETFTREEEIEALREGVRRELVDGIRRTMDDILKPYETYEEAYDSLYKDEVGIGTYSIDEEEMSVRMQSGISFHNGAFGALVGRLNDYLEQFGAEDGFFDRLSTALNELDPDETNALVNQMRSMVKTVRGGNAIQEKSESFWDEVKNAIYEEYGNKAGKQEEEEQKKKKEVHEDPRGMSFLDMQRHEAVQEGRLMDKLLGKDEESDEGFESAGDVLAKRKPEGKDAQALEFTDRLRHVEDRKEPEKPFTFETEEPNKGTRVTEREMEAHEALKAKWEKISQGLLGGIAEEANPPTAGKAQGNAGSMAGVDILV